jgi:hypothetical protein
MMKSPDPFRFLLIAVSGWMNQQQLQLSEWSRNWNALKRRDVRLSQSPAAVSLSQVSPG